MSYSSSHKIIRLYINRPSQSYVGLFGATGSGSEVKNVVLLVPAVR